MPCAHCVRIARVADDALRDAARALRATTRERDALARELARARETVTETQRAANDALVAALEAATRRGGAEAFARDRGSETKARGVRAVFDDVGPVPTTPTGRDGRRNE
jgi:hypothetical protein